VSVAAAVVMSRSTRAGEVGVAPGRWMQALVVAKWMREMAAARDPDLGCRMRVPTSRRMPAAEAAAEAAAAAAVGADPVRVPARGAARFRSSWSSA